jgi:L-amino acid N-acyltransferase YncA
MDALTAIYAPTGNQIIYRRERLMDLRVECQQIIEEHYQEIALSKGVQKLDPDWAEYDRLEKMGKIWLMTARHQGVLVGYIVMIVSTHLHYKNMLMALEDIHYLRPEFRKGLTGYKLISLAVKSMERLGIKKIVLRTKFFANHGRLFERLGFVREDEVWSKTLEG